MLFWLIHARYYMRTIDAKYLEQLFLNLYNHRLKLCFVAMLRCIVLSVQGLIEKLLILIKDPEYRVRRLLSRRIKVFFKTWNGHLGLLQDVW